MYENWKVSFFTPVTHACSTMRECNGVIENLKLHTFTLFRGLLTENDRKSNITSVDPM